MSKNMYNNINFISNLTKEKKKIFLNGHLINRWNIPALNILKCGCGCSRNFLYFSTIALILYA